MSTQLTAGQQAALKSGLMAETNPAIVAAIQDGTDNVITGWCNAKASPAVAAWQTAIQPADMDTAMLKAAGKLDTLTSGKQFSLTRFLTLARDFRINAIRNWITDIWGAATAGSDAEKILTACTESATRGEVYIAAGNQTKSTGTVTAIDRSFVGQLNDDDIAASLRGVGLRMP